MTSNEELFHSIAASLPDMAEGKMFGALCIKAPNGKSGVMFWHDDMIFKLDAAHEQEALKLEGATIFSPMEGRPMGGWVHVPARHSAKWKDYARISMEYVAKIEVEKKAKKPKK